MKTEETHSASSVSSSAIQSVYDCVLELSIEGSAHGEPLAILQQHPGVGGRSTQVKLTR